jgi:hypothetical protein
MSRSATVIAVIILTASVLCAQQPPAWKASQRYPNNPLRAAITTGSVTFAKESRPAELEIECRAPQLARINLRFPASDLRFDLDPFEGPPGIGQKRKLLTMQLDNNDPVPQFFNGFYVESNVFVFEIAPPRAKMAKLVSQASAGKPLTIKVSPADGKGESLAFGFILPADHQPALNVAKPCNDSKARDREPDPR